MANTYPDIELRVTSPRGNGGARRLLYDLRSRNGTLKVSLPTIEGPELHNPGGLRRWLFECFEAFQKGLGVEGEFLSGRDVREDFESLGRELYKRLFPPELRAAYRAFRGTAKTFLIISDEPWIPWEMIKPFDDADPAGTIDDDFLCCRFALSRWLPGTHSCAALEKRVHGIDVVEAPGSRQGAFLRHADREGERLRGIVGRPPETKVSIHRNVTLHDFRNLLNAADLQLLHFAGHGAMGAQSSDAWIELSDRPFRVRHLSGPVANRLRVARPVVIFNACQVGRLGFSFTDLDGWAEGWIRRANASAFLAPLWSVRDARAQEFVLEVYRRLRAHDSLGSAVHAARLRLREQEPDEMTWLAYSLYAHPLTRIVLGKDNTTVSVPPARS